MADNDTSTIHPRETSLLFGHAREEAALLDAYRSGRMPHAFIVGGPQGIGKATLAYRLARFVLAHPDPASPEVRQAQSLAVPLDHPASKRIVAGTHGGLLVLERRAGDNGTMRSIITVDQVRETVGFFGSTAAESGWRVCIVDAADDLKWPEAPNALLKILEEPPPRSLFLLVSHAPARLLPTILSRCRKLMLRPLGEGDVAKAAAAVTGRTPSDPDIATSAAASEGSIARALMYLEGNALDLRNRVTALLAQLPEIDQIALHGLGEGMGVADRAALRVFTDSVEKWIADQMRVADPGAEIGRLARLSEVWEKVSRAARDVESLNLERKPLVFSVFRQLAEVVRLSDAHVA